MKCPFCGHPEDRVVDSRVGREGEFIRRRRECLKCRRRYTTYEYIEDVLPMVVKRDGGLGNVNAGGINTTGLIDPYFFSGTASVPEPGSLWLVLSALAGL